MLVLFSILCSFPGLQCLLALYPLELLWNSPSPYPLLVSLRVLPCTFTISIWPRCKGTPMQICRCFLLVSLSYLLLPVPWILWASLHQTPVSLFSLPGKITACLLQLGFSLLGVENRVNMEVVPKVLFSQTTELFALCAAASYICWWGRVSLVSVTPLRQELTVGNKWYNAYEVTGTQ